MTKQVLSVDTLVYFSAFPKNSQTRYVCYGYITKVPEHPEQPYRVLIKGASSKSPDGIPLGDKRLLVGRAISKYERELTTTLGPIMTPKEWLE